MTEPHARGGLTRRDLMARGVAVGALALAGPGFIAAPNAAWAVETKALKPQTMATLIQVARDIYPHDRIADQYYAVAVKGHDDKAAEDAAHRALIEDGIADLDRRAGDGGYAAVKWERDRVSILEAIADGAFFQAVRGGLVVSLYNQKEVWPTFGYEGESYSEGGYIDRGFDAIAWL